jgi:Plant transposon protein
MIGSAQGLQSSKKFHLVKRTLGICPDAKILCALQMLANHPTIVLEAMADHNLFLWHASFGWAGTLNDLNIWEGSDLHRAFLDGTWSETVDFPFAINQQEFTNVLVDGIYPEQHKVAYSK